MNPTIPLTHRIQSEHSVGYLKTYWVEELKRKGWRRVTRPTTNEIAAIRQAQKLILATLSTESQMEKGK